MKNNSIDSVVSEIVFNTLDKFANDRVYVSINDNERRKTDKTAYEFMHGVEQYNIKLTRMITFYQTMINHYQDEKKKL